MKEIVAKALGILAALTVCGCATVNSEDAADRMAAVEKLNSQGELVDALNETQYEDVRIVVVKRIVEQGQLPAIVENNRFSDEVRCVALSGITNQEYLAVVVESSTCKEEYAVAALKGIKDPMLLCRCAQKTRFESLAERCVDRVVDEEALKLIVLGRFSFDRASEKAVARIKNESVLTEIVTQCKDQRASTIIVPRITKSETACRLIVLQHISNELKLLLADKIDDEAFLVEYVKNRNHPESVRRRCFAKVSRESSFDDFLSCKPCLEGWVVETSIRGTQNRELLVKVVLDSDFGKQFQSFALSQLSRQDEFIKLLKASKEDWLVNLLFEKIEPNWFVSAEGQDAIIRYFRFAKDDALCGLLLTKLNDKNLSALYRKQDQLKIARAIGLAPTGQMLSIGGKALFDDDVILDLVLGKIANNDKLALWALGLNPSESVLIKVALSSENFATQCRALERMSEEKEIARVAMEAKKSALRLAAITRLTVKSEDVLNILAQDADETVKNAAIERLRKIGGKKVVELERKAKEERQGAIEHAKKELQEQRNREKREQEAFEKQYLAKAGMAQLAIVRKYLEINSKAHIDSPKFILTGRIQEWTGRKMVLGMQSHDGEIRVVVEMSRESKESFSAGEIVSIAGFNDESTSDKVSLRCCELISRGIDLK